MNVNSLPKIELHCHLDGSIRPLSVIEIAKKDGIELSTYDLDKIKEKMIAPINCKDLSEYLTRFSLPGLVMQSKENLIRVTSELMEDAAKENVKYIEIRFAPQLHTQKGLTIEEVISSVITGMKIGEKKFQIYGNIILCCMRNFDVEKAFEVVEKGKEFLGRGVVGIDLCANENRGFCEAFQEPIKLAKEYGYRITIHAGETGIGENVRDAVKLLGAERIGHGVFIKDCPEAYDIVKKQGITLEMCPTSNIQTKAVKKFSEHPVYGFLKDGIKVTLNTDNRTVSNTNLEKEISLVSKEFHITYEEYRTIYYNSVKASFASETLKKNLMKFMK
ncbi:adenosine deaminase [Ilyobacter polytropus]|uniref:Adenosine deaminase n=1 Tax=Ilyobacter polytropus (strain ATCC 51220 / DSM 2926 / LMG 16218 / CuHBu1) TaxID=572544 RepID=E3HD55_ILYPC|nr:adenosine deaminase [Ilyobacter polytropus]ADO84531.1 adenosine deaminase [Ilyobacter polytropus DSM 2926]